MAKIESRTFSGATLRATSTGTDDLVLQGYAARFGVLSHPLPGNFREQIAPGAFSRSLNAGGDVVALLNHDQNSIPLGRTKSGTLRLAQDDKGLSFRVQLDKNQALHRDLHASVRRGDLDSCSFAFDVPDGGDSWDDSTDETGQPFARRTLRNVNL